MLRKYSIYFLKLVFVLLAGLHSVHGQHNLQLSNIITIHGDTSGYGFGNVVKNVGDINNDGYPDFAIGKARYVGSNDSLLWFKIDIYYGGSEFDTIPDITFPGEAAIIGNADFNGDGYIDLAMSNKWANWGGPWGISNAGRVHIYFGGAGGPDTLSDIEMWGEYWHHEFGSTMVSCDVNADGFDDLIVSAPHDDYAAYGRAYIFLGNSMMDSIPDWFYQSTEEFSEYGYTISCGDLDLDGYDDFIIGSPQFLENDGGKIDIYAGGDTISTIPVFSYSGENILGRIGERSYFIPVWETPNLGSFLVGYGYSDSSNYYLVNIMYDATLNTYSNSKLYLPYIDIYNNSLFFYDAADIGYNNDILPDIAISAPQFEHNQSRGAIFIFNNPFHLDTPDTILYSIDPNATSFGNPFCVIDIDMDGNDELISAGRKTVGGSRYEWIEILSSTLLRISDNDIFSEASFFIEKNYPNPFNPITTLTYYLPFYSDVQLTIYDLLGRQVKTLGKQHQNAGQHSITWDATNRSGESVSAGIYFYHLRAGDFNATGKMLLLK